MARGKQSGIFQRDNGLWVGRIELPSHDGDRRRKEFTSKDKNQVIKRMSDLNKQLKAAGDLPTASMTVGEWNAYWLREIAQKTRRPATISSYKSVLARVNKSVGSVRLDKLTPVHVRKVLSAMGSGENPASSTYLRNTHSVMAASFKDAEREGRIGRSPVDLVPSPLKAVTHLEVLNADQVKNLITALDQTDLGYLWATFLLTGARRGEVIGLEWDRIGEIIDMSWQMQRVGKGPVPANFEVRPIKGGLFWTRPKSRAGWREIPLVEPLRTILETWRAKAPSNQWGLVFTRLDEDGNPIPLDPSWVGREWKMFREANGLGHVRLHDLRHTTVDMLYAAGVSEPDIQAIVGHSTVAMTRSYKSPATRERLAGSMRMLSTSLGYDS
jgi:integrase